MAFEALADEGGFVCVGEDGIEGGFDVAVGDAASAEFSRDAESSLAAGLRVLASIIERELCVVEVILFAEARNYGCDGFFVLGAAREIFLHFVDRVGPAHQRTERGGVKLLVGGRFARGRTHGRI